MKRRVSVPLALSIVGMLVLSGALLLIGSGDGEEASAAARTTLRRSTAVKRAVTSKGKVSTTVRKAATNTSRVAPTTRLAAARAGLTFAELCGGVSTRRERPLAGVKAHVLTPATGLFERRVRTSDELRAALASISGPTALLLQSGDYTGSFEVPLTPDTGKLLIRPEQAGSVRFVGATTFDVRRQSVAFEGFRFETDVAKTFTIRAAGITIAGNTFTEAGGGEPDDSHGLIFVPNDATNWDPGGVLGIGAPEVDLRLVVSENDFIKPKNSLLWQNHGVVGTRFVSNNVVGPHGMRANGGPASFAAAVKVGYGFGLERTGTIITNNVFSDWSAVYVIGIKGGGASIENNWLDRGRIALRGGSGSIVKGNVLLDGGIDVMGSDHSIEANYVRLVSDPGTEGPLIVHYGEARLVGDLLFDGTSLPLFVPTTRSSVFKSNVLISAIPFRWTVTVFVGPDPSLPFRAEANVFTGNTFMGTASDQEGRSPVGLISRGDEAAFLANNKFSGSTFVRLVSETDRLVTAAGVDGVTRSTVCG